MRQLVIFGASKLGLAAYAILGDNYISVYFCDNDPRKWGKQINNVEVISPETLKDKMTNHNEIDIIIASQYGEEISDQLVRMGINQFKIFSSSLINPKDKQSIEALSAYYTLKAFELTLKRLEQE